MTFLVCYIQIKNIPKIIKKEMEKVKSTGITRKIDDLGRIVLPIELRKQMGIGQRDPIEIYVDGDSIILKKYQSECIFCGSKKGLSEYKGKHVCESCAKELANK